MIDKLVEFGKTLRDENSHDAIREEPIHIQIIIDAQGNFHDFIDCEPNQKTISEAILAKKGKARLLVDKLEETLNFDEKKHKLYIDKLLSYQNIDILNPVILFYGANKSAGLEKAKEQYECQYRQAHEKSNSTMHYCFRLITDNKRINEYSEVLDEIKKRYDEKQAANKSDKICSICGTSDYPITDSPHGAIKSVPNGQSSGCALVSYNERAFESYNLNGNLNSSICERCAKNYTSGLNELLGNYKTLTNDKGKPYREYKYRKSLGSDAAILFWLRSGNNIKEIPYLEDRKSVSTIQNKINFDGGVLSLMNNTTTVETRVEAFKTIFNSIHRVDGDEVYQNVDDEAFYSMIVSGEASRILVRSWVETNSANVKNNIAKWFDDITLYNYYKKEIEVFTMYDLVGSVTTDSYIAKKLYEYLYNTALFAKTIPIYVLKETIKSFRMNIYKSKYIKNENIALIKLALNRSNTKRGGFNMKNEFDNTNISVPYVAGRIFAMYEVIQERALGDVNAGIREKFFTSASTTPARAFGRLANMSIKHISKLEKDSEKCGIARFYDMELQELFSKIDASKGFPTLFTIEEQGQFVIGYYHQKQKIYTKKKDDSENNTNTNEQA